MNFGSLVHKQHVCGNCVTACRSVHLCCDGVPVCVAGSLYASCAHGGYGTRTFFAKCISLCPSCMVSAASHSFCDFSLVTGRICVVNNDGGVLIDQYVQPQEKVTDYRTFVSGIEPKHLKHGAVSLSEAQKMVAQILTGRILVGHSVHHDLQVNYLPHLCHVLSGMHKHAMTRIGTLFSNPSNWSVYRASTVQNKSGILTFVSSALRCCSWNAISHNAESMSAWSLLYDLLTP